MSYKNCSLNFFCTQELEFPIQNKILTKNGYYIFKSDNPFLFFQWGFEWPMAVWCENNLLKFKDADKIILDDFDLSTEEQKTFRYGGEHELVKMFTDLKNLRIGIISKLSWFFPENVKELTWYDLRYSGIWETHIRENLKEKIPTVKSEPERFFLENHFIETVYDNIISENPQLKYEIMNIEFGKGNPVNDYAWETIEWIFRCYEKIASVLTEYKRINFFEERKFFYYEY